MNKRDPLAQYLYLTILRLENPEPHGRYYHEQMARLRKDPPEAYRKFREVRTLRVREWKARKRAEDPNYFPKRYEKTRRAHNLKKYGLTQEQYDALLKAQGGCCVICPRSGSGDSRTKYLFVDHEHKTGKVRGLLCGPCNAALGAFGDSCERLKVAIAYLQAHDLKIALREKLNALEHRRL